MPDDQEQISEVADEQPHVQDPGAYTRLQMEHGELKAQHEKLQITHGMLKNDRDRLIASLSDLKRELTELQQAHGIIVRPQYEYKEDECRPVPVNGVCEQCGWDYATQRRPDDTQREPHPIQA